MVFTGVLGGNGPTEREGKKVRQFDDIMADESLRDPAEIHLACGHTIPNTGGVEVFNYYDLKVTVSRRVTMPEVDTSGLLPNGVTYWFSDVDGSRATCLDCARRRHPERFGAA